MKTFCFNYAIEGMMTFLPLFICLESTNQFKAYRIAKRYLNVINKGRKVTVWFKNFPDSIDNKFTTSRVPSDFR